MKTKTKTYTLLKNRAYINGEWESGNSTFRVTNPANGDVIQEVADLSLESIEKSIQLAHDAWECYKKRDAYYRSNLLKNWYELIQSNRNELADIITLESGKPLMESYGEIDYGLAFVEWFYEEAKRNYGDVIPTSSEENRVITIRQGIGVVTAITSWNFPLAMITRKVAPAIAAGCTVVLRPASKTPLTALALAQLAKEAGWPKGIFNVVTSTQSSAAGKLLSQHHLVRKLSFTGSTGVGKVLAEQAASSVKKVSLELGGNASFIVFEDANIQEAVKGALFAKFRNAGQTCVAVNRFYVHDKVYNQFVNELTDAVKSLKVGNGIEEGVSIGPLVDQKGLNKVIEHVENAISYGAKLHLGGKPLQGLFFEPTILADLSDQALITNEETFGPVISIYRFFTEKEVIAKANASEYGLASYFYSQNQTRCWRVSEALEAGIVGVNTGKISFAAAPFGGIKSSGYGREGSKYGLEEFTEIKYINFGLV